jgi:hypothetical protein
MPKKKKTQLKPVTRGFAVTSIPKKAPPETPPSQDDEMGESAPPEIPQVARPDEPVEDEATRRQKAEERSLQDLVEKLQEKTEKEIVRTVRVQSRIYMSLHIVEDRWLTQPFPVRLSRRIDDFPILCHCLTWMRILLVRY